MKKLTSILTSVCLALVAFSSVALAEPEGKGTGPAMNTTDFDGLKAGDQVMLVCKACKSSTKIDVKDAKMATELCREGRMVDCATCKKQFKTVIQNPTGKTGGAPTEVVLVDDKGAACMYYSKAN